MNQVDITNRIRTLVAEVQELVAQLEPAAPQGPLPVKVIDQPVLVQGEVVTASPVVNKPVSVATVIETGVVTEKPVVVAVMAPAPVIKTVPKDASPVGAGVVSTAELDEMFGRLP